MLRLGVAVLLAAASINAAPSATPTQATDTPTPAALSAETKLAIREAQLRVERLTAAIKDANGKLAEEREAFQAAIDKAIAEAVGPDADAKAYAITEDLTVVPAPPKDGAGPKAGGQ